MKLPLNTEISKEKITEYLIKKRDENDKSQFLSSAGYSLENYEQLMTDIRDQILTIDAEEVEETSFGKKFEICGTLRSPAGSQLKVVTIWMKERSSNRWNFITLFPARSK